MNQTFIRLDLFSTDQIIMIDKDKIVAVFNRGEGNGTGLFLAGTDSVIVKQPMQEIMQLINQSA